MGKRGVATGPGAAALRVGVLGCGYWGAKHARVLHSMRDVCQLVLIDRREDRLAALAPMFAKVACYPDLSSALTELDALVIATPPSSHVALGLVAIEAGVHVLIEKPLATNVFGARRLIAAARDAGVILMTGHTFEYNAVVWRMRELIQGHHLGDLYHLDSARLNLGLYQTDVNVLWDLAPHDVSILNHLLGRSPTWVEAWSSRHAHHRLDDVAYLRLRYDETELQANIHVSWLDPCKVRRLTAVGSKKMAVYNDLATEERIRIYDKGVSRPEAQDDLAQAPMSYRYGDIVAPYVAMEEPLSVQDHHFVCCVQSGTQPNTDGRNGLAVVEVLEAAQLSARQGRRVHIDEVMDGTAAEPEEVVEHSFPELTAGMPAGPNGSTATRGRGALTVPPRGVVVAPEPIATRRSRATPQLLPARRRARP